jgi:transcriptional regulator with XRE-family HTH domain
VQRAWKNGARDPARKGTCRAALDRAPAWRGTAREQAVFSRANGRRKASTRAPANPSRKNRNPRYCSPRSNQEAEPRARDLWSNGTRCSSQISTTIWRATAVCKSNRHTIVCGTKPTLEENVLTGGGSYYCRRLNAVRKYQPLPPSELAICDRVKRERLHERATQASFARMMGLTRDQLASIEVGRVPLRFSAGWKLCRIMNMNPLWLATGEGESSGFAPFNFGRVSPRARFSEVVLPRAAEYDNARDERWVDEFIHGLSVEEEAITALRDQWKVKVPANELSRFARYLRRCAHRFFDVNPPLTRRAIAPILSPVRARKSSYWKQLRRRLISVTTPPGAKAKLARHLGLSRQAVSEWIRRDDRAPSAEYTLRLLEWVTAEEARQTESV